MRKRVLVEDQETRGRGRRQDKLVLSLQEFAEPRACGVVLKVQHALTGDHWEAQWQLGVGLLCNE